jgi:hypothetical protein
MTERGRHAAILVLLNLISSLFSLRLYAQAPKVQLFGGYSLAVSERTPHFPVRISNEWGTSVAITPSIRAQELSLVLQVDGSYAPFSGNTVGNRDVLGGVRFTPMVVSGWWEKLLFIHALVGVANVSRLSGSHNSFAWDIGGGLDIPINHRAGWRAIQIDYRQTNPTSNLRNEVRFSTGLTLSFKRFIAIE